MIFFYAHGASACKQTARSPQINRGEERLRIALVNGVLVYIWKYGLLYITYAVILSDVLNLYC